jgi:hypothetical protein
VTGILRGGARAGAGYVEVADDASQYVDLHGMGGRLAGRAEFGAGDATVEVWLHLFSVPKAAAHAFVWEFGVGEGDRLGLELQHGRPCVVFRNPDALDFDVGCARADQLTTGLQVRGGRVNAYLAGWLVCWFAGLLACWLASLLACWFACLLASCGVVWCVCVCVLARISGDAHTCMLM